MSDLDRSAEEEGKPLVGEKSPRSRRLLRRLLRAVAWGVGCFFGLLLLVCVLLYVPPVQRWAVRTTCEALSDGATQVRIGEIRLWFPLTLHVGKALATSEGDTLLRADRLDVSVQLWPLVRGRVEMDELLLQGAYVNTLAMVEALQLKGSIGELSVETNSMDLAAGEIDVKRIRLSRTDLLIALSDSVAEAEEEESEPTEWTVLMRAIETDSVALDLRLAPQAEGMAVGAFLEQASLKGMLDLGTGTYSFEQINASGSALALDLDGSPRAEGFDYSHLRLSDVALEIPSVVYRGSDGSLSVEIENFAGRELAGLWLTGTQGLLLMDSTSLTLKDFQITTAESDLALQFRMDMDAFALPAEDNPDFQPGQFAVEATAHLGKGDIAIAAGPQLGPTVMKALPAGRQTLLMAAASGNLQQLTLSQLYAYMPEAFAIEAQADMQNITDTLGGMGIDAAVEARTMNLDFVKAFAGDSLQEAFNIPRGMELQAHVGVQGSDVTAVAHIATPEGSAHVDADYGGDSERYRADVRLNHFLFNQFVPLGDTVRLTTNLAASGKGFDPFSPHAAADASFAIEEGCFGAYDLSTLQGNLQLHDGQLQTDIAVGNSQVDATASLSGSLPGDTLGLQLNLCVDKADLRRMGLAEDTLLIATQATAQVHTNLDRFHTVDAHIEGVDLQIGKMRTTTYPLTLRASTQDSLTTLSAEAGDLTFRFDARSNLLDMLAALSDMGAEALAELGTHALNPAVLKTYLPQASLRMDAGQENPLATVMRMNGMEYSAINADMIFSPDMGVGGRVLVRGLQLSEFALDTIFLGLKQDSAQFVYHAAVTCPDRTTTTTSGAQETRPGFRAAVDGYLATRSADLHLLFKNLSDSVGIDLGLHAALDTMDLAKGDSVRGLDLSFYPQQPILAYRRFAVNEDNFVRLDAHNSLSANVQLNSLEDSCSIALCANPTGDLIQDIQLTVQKLDLGQLITLLPDAPNLNGLINIDAGYHATQEHFWVTGQGGVESLTYDHALLGDVQSEFAYRPQGSSTHEVFAKVMHNDSEVVRLSGSYTDSLAGALDAQLTLNHLPLELLNPMLSDMMFTLGGALGGEMSVSGPMDALLFNGQLQPDSMTARYDLYSIGVRFDDSPLVITNSRLAFDKYKVYGYGDNPITIDGWVDFADFDRIAMEVGLGGQNVQLVDAQKNSKTVLYGELFGDLFVKVSGLLSDLSVRGLVRLLSSSNVTYVMTDTPLTIEDRLSDIVTFVDFTAPPDTTLSESRSLLALDMQITVSVEEGATLRAEFSADKQSYVEVKGDGNLTLTSTPEGVMTLLGKYTINEGIMKYALSVIPLKSFDIAQGSYIEFTGEMMNPTLNFKATEETKTSVTDESGNRRSVRFLSGLSVTGTLENMELAFTLEAPEDMTIQNELAGLSAEEKNKLAVGILCTGLYLGSSNSSGISANNALNNYLQSEINNIAGKALASTVDVDLGMEQSTDDDGSTRTDYSFKFSKRFFSDRLSVVVGGKVSDGSSTSGQSGTYIDNVSLEWRLNTAGTRYVKIYHEENYDNLIEGELTENGVSFVYKKKLDSLSELYFWK